MDFVRNREPRVRGYKSETDKGRASSCLPIQSEIQINWDNTILRWKLDAMIRGDHDRIDELAMLWSLNRFVS